MSSGPLMPAARPAAQFSRLLPYAQLLRIPNVFTAMADIGLAALAAGALPSQFFAFLLLLLASSCLYAAGMAWNDYFDYSQDLKERPQRPLPSHKIPRRTAARLGVALLIAGIFMAALAGINSDGYHPAPLLVAVLLAASIIAYDSRAKRTFLGPVSMGLCRFLNVLLGLTISDQGIEAWGALLALIVGVYIVGVTWFARREAQVSRRLELAAATLLMLTALVLALFLPLLGPQLARQEGSTGTGDFLFGDLGHVLFPYLLVGFGFWIGIPAVSAVRQSGPKQVQTVVKRAVLGLIALDAILATALAGTSGLLILLLWPPALVLGKWVYST